MTNFVKMATLGLSAFALFGFAQPALAADEAARSASANAASAAESPQAKRADTRKYCVNTYVDTGSRLGRPQCKTKKEWADEGVEITPKK